MVVWCGVPWCEGKKEAAAAPAVASQPAVRIGTALTHSIVHTSETHGGCFSNKVWGTTGGWEQVECVRTCVPRYPILVPLVISLCCERRKRQPSLTSRPTVRCVLCLNMSRPTRAMITCHAGHASQLSCNETHERTNGVERRRLNGHQPFVFASKTPASSF